MSWAPVLALASVLLGAPSTTPAAGSPLLFSSYFGGTGMEQFRDAVTDAAGNVYLVGGTGSSNVRTTSGAYDTTFNGNVDVLVVKTSPTGQLLWSSVVGGPNYDRAYAVELDPQGNVVVAGRAGSGFPTTAGVVQPTFAGDTHPNSLYGQQDGFIAKLASDGRRLLWSTYWGASDDGFVRDIAVDAQGNVYPASYSFTGYANPHVTAGALQTTHAAGVDGLYAKISADGTQVVWCTYLGGNADDGQTPSVRADANGVVIEMYTDSTNLPTTVGAFDRTYNGGTDLYVARIAPDGSRILWGTYLGGSGLEFSETHGLALDGAGDVYVAATTMSTNFPVTAGVVQPAYGGSGGSGTGQGTNYPGDGFVTKLGGADGRLVASTYLGGRYGDGVEGISVDASGRPVVSGATYSNNFPVTADARQLGLAGSSDFFVVQLAADLTRRVYATYLGGSKADNARANTVDANGNIVVLGEVSSTNWPVISGTQSAYGGGTFDAGVARFGAVPPVGTATPTRTRTPTIAVTRTPTRTPTRSPSPSVTATAPPAAQSPTRTPTRFATATGRAATATPTPSQTPTPTRKRHSIRGFVGYFSTLTPVAGARVDVSGDAAYSAVTDPSGQFSVTDLGEADWRVQPSKGDDLGTAVSALDAAYVLQATVGLRQFTSIQQAICDVSGNGTISALDAALILQRVAGIIGTFPVSDGCGHQWVFEPVPVAQGNQIVEMPGGGNGECRAGATTFHPLDIDVDNQAFLAGVVGDCTGNWRPAGAGGTEASLAPAER